MQSGQVTISLLGLILALVVGSSTLANDFRISSRIFFGDTNKAIAENETIFQGDTVYDFSLSGSKQAGSKQTVVFDLLGQSFVLLDAKRSVKSSLNKQELQQLVAQLIAKIQARPAGAKAVSPAIRFAIKPTFAEKTGPTSISLDHELLSYETATQSVPANVASKYGVFSDYYCQLNAVRGGMPPAARMRLNELLVQKKHIPTSVFLRRATIDPQKPLRLRSKHDFVAELSRKDQKRITQAKKHIANFREVPFLGPAGAAFVAAEPATSKQR